MGIGGQEESLVYGEVRRGSPCNGHIISPSRHHPDIGQTSPCSPLTAACLARKQPVLLPRRCYLYETVAGSNRQSPDCELKAWTTTPLQQLRRSFNPIYGLTFFPASASPSSACSTGRGPNPAIFTSFRNVSSMFLAASRR